MTTSPETSILSKPVGSERVPVATLEYFRARNRHRFYDLILDEMLASGITKADLAKRLGGSPARITRVLGAPSNLTLDTVSDLLFAISGAEATYSIAYPLAAPRRNYARPDWLASPTLKYSVGEHSALAGIQAEQSAIQSKTRQVALPKNQGGVLSALADVRQ